jgi:sugar lactone lactonase YvrE
MRCFKTERILASLVAACVANWVASSATADLLVSSWGAQRVYNVDEDTGLGKDFPGQPGVNSFPVPRVNDVMVGPDGMIYAASEADDTVYRIDPNAVPADVAGLAGLSFLGGARAELQEAAGLIFDAAGNLYVSDQFDGEIYQYDTAGSHLGVYDTGLGRVGGMAFLADGSGRMIAAGGAGHVVIAAGGASNAPFSVSTPTKNGINNGSATVAIDSDGNVLITNTGGYGSGNGIEANTVARFDPNGNWIEDVVASTGLNTHVSGQGSHPAVLEGPEGDVFLVKKHGNSPPTTVPYSWFRFDSGGLNNTSGVPDFGGRDLNSQGGFGIELRGLWLWDAAGDGSGHSDPVTKQYTVIPEPGSFVMLAIAMLAPIGIRARRRSRK